MDVNDRAGDRRRGAVLALGLLIALLAAVAVASSGSVPAGSGGARRPSHQLIDTLVSLVLVLLVLGIVLFGVLIALGRDVLTESARLRRERGRLSGLLTGGAAFLLLAIAVWVAGSREPPQRAPERDPGRGANVAAEEDAARYNPQFALLPVLIVGGLATAGIAAALVSYARRRSLREPTEDVALVLADVLEETLDDLRAEHDARRAVVAAYARMERALTAYGLPRSAAEAPEEYVERILGDLEVGTLAVRRLTALYTHAKFSQHDVDTGMKDKAIDALVAVREELRAAERRASEERAAALVAARERAAPS